MAIDQPPRGHKIGQPTIEISDRAAGILFLIAGLGFSIWQIFLPLRDAAAGAEELSHQGAAVALAPLLWVHGVLYTFFTDWTTRVFGEIQRPSPKGWILGLLLIAAGFALLFWLRQTFEDMGYVFEGPFGGRYSGR